MKLFTLLVILFSLAGGYAQDYKNVSDIQSVKDAIQKKHNDTKSITADFTEKVVSEMFKEPQISKGKLTFKKENKVRWEKASSKQLILIDGDKVKLYENNKLVSNPTSQKIVKQIQGMMLNMLSGNFLNEKDFSIGYFENTQNYKLILLPKSPRMSKYISTIELYFNKSTNLLNEMVLVESKNQKISYTFTNLKTNQSINDSLFKDK